MLRMFRFELGFIFSVVVFAITMAAGWVMNIVHLIDMPLAPVTMELIVRFMGIVVVPVGAVMGLFF